MSEVGQPATAASASTDEAAARGYTVLQATIHRNMGLLYLSQAMSDHPDIVPGRAAAEAHNRLHPRGFDSGKNVQALDAKKINRALKHYMAALELSPGSRMLHIHLARLYHDCCVCPHVKQHSRCCCLISDFEKANASSRPHVRNGRSPLFFVTTLHACSRKPFGTKSSVSTMLL